MIAARKQLHRYRASHRGRMARASAFTLLELVLAMGMASVVAISMYACVRIGFKAKDSSEANVEPSRTAELAMDLLRLDFQNAISPNRLNPTSSSTRVNTVTRYLSGPFIGTQGQDERGHENDNVNFYTTADGPQHPNLSSPDLPTGDGDIRQVELAMQTVGNDHVLIRRVTSNLLANGQAPYDDEVLCRGVSAFTVEYTIGGGSSGITDQSGWMTSWDSGLEDNTIPTAVRITIELERPSGTLNAQNVSVLRFSRIFMLPCSTAATDQTLN